MDYQQLYENYSQREKRRAFISIATCVAGVVVAALTLKKLHDEQQGR